MKSRKLGFFGKRSLNRRTSANLRRGRQALRNGLLEKLEDRQMMAADWNPALVGATGLFTSAAARTAVVNYVASRGTSSSGSAAMFAEGAPTTAVTINEMEPNNSFFFAQPITLNTSTTVTLVGNNTNQLDEDWVSFNLNAGDIFDVRLNSNASVVLPLLSLYNSSNTELIASSALIQSYPANSPLTGSASATVGNAGLSYIVPTTGKYYFRLGDVLSTYTVTFNVYRPPMESQPAGTQQILFLDFDGASVPRNTVGFGVGTARMSPISQSLAGWGLLPVDEPLLIDEITQRVADKFTYLQLNSTNPNVAIKVINSKDALDPWGSPNVSRAIVGGTYQQLVGNPTVTNPGLIGIAESVDLGNFNTTETTLIMQDVLIASSANAVPIGGPATRIQYIAEVIASVIAHEAGHYFGGFHQDPTNLVNGIMDQFYAPAVFAGVGRDLTFGTADDERLNFTTDAFVQYLPFTPNNIGQPLPGGVDDTITSIGWALSGGKVGGRINGNVFNDRNVNRVKDAGDLPIASVRVYTDLNGNSVYDSGEFTAFSDAAGNYSILVPSGTYTVREVIPTGYRLTAPLAGFLTATVVGTNTVSNINFGQEQLSLNATGVKWNDINGNGLRDVGEGAVSGTRMYIDLDGDARIDIGEPSAKTDAFGNYSLTFPGPGTYTVREVIDPGYVQTFPGFLGDFGHTVVVTGNPTVDALTLAGLNFGNQLNVDFGDAPVSYGEASAGFVAGLALGVNWDSEQISNFSATALGDDNTGLLDFADVVIDDEDGIVFTRPIVAGSTTNRVAVDVTNTSGLAGYLNAWIDFNQDGDFGDAGEQIFTNTLVDSSTILTFSAPAGGLLGNTFARFRYSLERDVAATGRSLSGEVEDYRVSIVDRLQLAVDDQYTVARNSVLNPLDVLSNDFALPGETLDIVTTSGSSAGGVVQVGANGQILYTPPAGFVGQDVFTYTMRNSLGETGTATVIVNVRLFFVNPVSVDDSFDVAVNAIDFPLNVLANDIEGQSGALTIIMVTQPSSGGQINISSGGKALRYTPVRNFNGTETFTYTVADAGGNQSTASVTLHTLPYVNANTDVVYSLVATDLNGNPITAIQQGQQFKIDVFTDDFRNDRGAPVAAPGVYAAYLDLLYNLQLVTTATPANPALGLNFDVGFFNSYVNGISGDASIPGIINEFGAFNSTGNNADPGSMNFPDRVRVASITFVANSAGVAKFIPDPADITPTNDTLLFDPGTSVPVPRIRYLSTSIEIIGDSAEFPLAVDDSLSNSIPFGAVRYPIVVLANDLPGSTGSVTVTSATSGLSGSTTIDSQGRVLYTPNGGFSGTDQFQYTIQDARGIASTATVTVRVGNTDANDVISLPLRVTDLNGSPITSIAVGGQFQLRGYVQDLRTAGVNLGVFAAYADVLINGSSLVSTISAPVSSTNPLGFQATFGPNYQRVVDGDNATRGLINEIGAVQTGDLPLGNGEQLLYTITFTANSAGTVSFVGDPADISPLHDSLTFDPVVPVGFDRIRFGFSGPLTITPVGNLGGGEFTNLQLPQDVNADGFVSPIDALVVINALNSGRRVSTGSGEGENGTKMFIDVNGDNNLSPIDALLVINYLNSIRSAAAGEGEGEASGQLLQVLSSGGLATSTLVKVDGNVQSVTPETNSQAATATTLSATHEADYCTSYGPEATAAADSVFGTDDSGLEELLSHLAPDVESTLKKRA